MFRSRSSRTPFFSDDDVRNIIASYPPSSATNDDAKRFDPDHAFLIPNRSNEQLIRPSEARDELRRLLVKESGRPSISSLAKEVDIGEDVLISLVEQLGESDFLAEDRNHFITRKERGAILSNLQKLAKRNLVNIFDFAVDNLVTPNCLIQIIQEHNTTVNAQSLIHIHEEAATNGKYCYSTALRNEFLTSLSKEVDAANRRATPLDVAPFQPDHISFLKEVLEDIPAITQGAVTCEADQLLYVPRSYFSNETEQVIQGLCDGTKSHQEIAWFSSHATQEELSSSEVPKQLQEAGDDKIWILDDVVVSRAWLGQFLDTKLLELKDRGWSDLSDNLPNTSLGDRNVIFDYLTEEAQKERKVWSSVSRRDEVRGLVDIPWGEQLAITLRDRALEDLNGGSLEPSYFTVLQKSAELSLNMPELVDHATRELLPRAINDILISELTNSTQSAVSAALQQTLKTRHYDISTLWSSRLTTRLHLHTIALSKLDSADPKLALQLRESLNTYLRTDLIPETLSKANLGDPSILTSGNHKKVRKSFDRLKALTTDSTPTSPTTGAAGLRQPKKESFKPEDLSLTLDALQAFGAALSLPNLATTAVAPSDPAALATKRASLLEDMYARTQRDNDPARLLLSLLILITALTNPKLGSRPASVVSPTSPPPPRASDTTTGSSSSENSGKDSAEDTSGNGVLYATGKAIPRLIKALTVMGVVDFQGADKLERLKDEIRNGRIRDEGKEDMRAWARAVVGKSAD